MTTVDEAPPRTKRAGKIALRTIDPVTLACFRLVLAALVMLPIYFAMPNRTPPPDTQNSDSLESLVITPLSEAVEVSSGAIVSDCETLMA